MRFLTAIGIVLLLMACGREQKTTDTAAGQHPKQADHHAIILKGISLPLKEAPDANAKTIKRLEEGEKVFLTGQQSINTTALIWNGTTYEEPWLLVRTEQEQEGWVHGLVVYLSGDSTMHHDPYWHMLFGTALSQEIDSLRDEYASAQSAASVLAAFNRAQQLKEALVEKVVTQGLQQKVAAHLDELQEVLPAMAPYIREKEFALFLDLKQWHAKARTTDDACDDHLFAFYFKLYPIDSIEYFYPAWSLEVAAGEAYNLLGDSIHYTLLKDLDEWPDCNGLLAQEKRRIKQAVINDLMNTNVLYWNKREKVLAEMAKIVETPLACITMQEQQLIQQRLDELLQDEEGTTHLFNYRSGK
jgi:hypothetical protein